MLWVPELKDIAAIGPLLVGLPESTGLLVVGLGLVAAAVLLRRILGGTAKGKSTEDLKNTL